MPLSMLFLRLGTNSFNILQTFLTSSFIFYCFPHISVRRKHFQLFMDLSSQLGLWISGGSFFSLALVFLSTCLQNLRHCSALLKDLTYECTFSVALIPHTNLHGPVSSVIQSGDKRSLSFKRYLTCSSYKAKEILKPGFQELWFRYESWGLFIKWDYHLWSGKCF